MPRPSVSDGGALPGAAGLPATMLDAWRRTAAQAPAVPLLMYMQGWQRDAAGVDADSDALAWGLRDMGIGRGDRVAVCLQNVPEYVIALLAIWKAGAVGVNANPMYRARELGHLLADSGATLAIVHPASLRTLREAAALAPGAPAVRAVTVSPTALLESAERDELARVFGTDVSAAGGGAGAEDLWQLVRRCRGRGAPPAPAPPLRGDDVAFLTYTSGTTGPAKGAMNTHRNCVWNTACWAHVPRLSRAAGDRVLGVAPLFHITGLIAHIGVALLAGVPLALHYRFDPALCARIARERGCTMTCAAITVFTALLADPRVRGGDLSRLRKAYTGGAPVAPATLDAFRERFGIDVLMSYGLTEVTSPSHLGPLGVTAPVHPEFGAVAVGQAAPGMRVRLLEPGKDHVVPIGAQGEVCLAGPAVVPGYWRREKETRAAFGEGGELRTGDVGVMDDGGWLYIVDRLKDQINASGYKVWPREVEDALVAHPRVREAAVVGAPDAYRGETVVAYVAAMPGAPPAAAELRDWCRARLAAYKAPARVEVVAELPKSPAGKILRRILRDRAKAEAAGKAARL